MADPTEAAAPALDLEGLERLLAEATPGPWRDGFLDGSGAGECITAHDADNDGRFCVLMGGDSFGLRYGFRRRADIATAIAAVNALPALLRLARAAGGTAQEAEARGMERAAQIVADAFRRQGIDRPDCTPVVAAIRAVARQVAPAPSIPEKQPGPALSEDGRVLIWSYEHDAWWAPNRCGYTTNRARAGRYSRDEAEQIVRSANCGGERNETIVPEGNPAPVPAEGQGGRGFPMWVSGVEGCVTDWRAVANELIERVYRQVPGTAIVDQVLGVVRKHSAPSPHPPEKPSEGGKP